MLTNGAEHLSALGLGKSDDLVGVCLQIVPLGMLFDEIHQGVVNGLDSFSSVVVGEDDHEA